MICDGEGWLKIRESEYLPQPGQWFLMPQGVKQSYSLTDGPRFTKYWCHFTARIGESNLFDLLMVPCYIDTYGDAEPVRLFRELLSCETSDALTSPLLLKAAMYNLIAYFLEHAYGTEAGIHPAAVSEPLQTVVAYIHDHYSDNLTIRELADRAHLHPNYFIRLFKRHFGTSPDSIRQPKKDRKSEMAIIYYEPPFVRDRRLRRDPRHLYLSKLFRSMTGFSPSTYRKTAATTGSRLPSHNMSLKRAGFKDDWDSLIAGSPFVFRLNESPLITSCMIFAINYCVFNVDSESVESWYTALQPQG